MIRVCIAGITGWVGRPLAAAVAASDDLELVAGVARSDPEHFSSVDQALAAGPVDVLVDYTSATAVKANVIAALDRGVGVVIGSSGLSGEDFHEIDRLAQEAGLGVIAAGNFSLTAALMLRFAAEAARHLDQREVIDYASANKPDAPSGTAREVAERMAASGPASQEIAVSDVLGPREARGASVATTQVHSLRLPSFSVSTEVIFAAADERLSIRHDAGHSATPYLAGTLLAIRSLPGRVGLVRGLDHLLF